ncbi:LysR family transcriptional regulator [Microbulbifer sp. A4B17]|uniref:LysR family transcriptional regulator n=1 Tax=Microbulbifer sp. A4B17 TaxID=359370 RepID=UPI000D52CB23|nr:LysR family transcriptional regulator [Microbulbifer sp. A4B17]AWF80253.1 LysR family transcriptional regulator [Microbulbifer sp. A4B17]
MINPVWLRSFCTLAEEGHFTRTADRLHMTQSGVSQHIRKLEEHLGVALLVRKGKHFTLTDAGDRLYCEGQGIVQKLSNLGQIVGEDPPHRGVVRVMCPGSVGLKLYPKLLSLQKLHRGLAISCRFAPNLDVEKAIVENDVDIGLMTSPSQVEEIDSRPIASEKLLLVTPAEVVSPDWEKLLALGYIGHPDGIHHASLLLGANFPQFRNLNVFQQKGFSNQISLILEPVGMGLGFTVLPSYAVNAFRRPKLIKAHSLEKPVSETLFLALRRTQVVSARVRFIIGEMEKWL